MVTEKYYQDQYYHGIAKVCENCKFFRRIFFLGNCTRRPERSISAALSGCQYDYWIPNTKLYNKYELKDREEGIKMKIYNMSVVSLYDYIFLNQDIYTCDSADRAQSFSQLRSDLMERVNFFYKDGFEINDFFKAMIIISRVDTETGRATYHKYQIDLCKLWNEHRKSLK